MSDYKTAKKSDADFNSFLMGTFSNTHAALPVQSLNVGTADEVVTFEIVHVFDIKRPNYFVYWLHLIKLRQFILILFPLLYVITKNYVDNRFFDPFSLSLASVAMILLFAGLNVRNDVLDHVSGFDRVNFSHSPKPIAKGWITASEASFLSSFLIAMGFLFSIPVMILQREEIRVVLIIAVLALIGKFFQKNSYKNQRIGEVILFLLMGPGLVSGYQVAVGAGVDTEVLAFGFVWGVGILFLQHLNNFSHLMTSTQAKIHNTMTRFGFDRSKKFLILWWALFLFLWLIYHFLYAGFFWTWFGGAVLFFWSIPTAIKLSAIHSPVGSDLVEAKKVGYRNFILAVVVWTVEQVWHLGTKTNWTL